MAQLSKGRTFIGGETVTAAKLNQLVDLATISNITNADVSASAAIAGSKLADSAITNAKVSASAAIALSKLATGALPSAITVSSANIVDGTIVDADVSASAAIAGTKVAPDFGSQAVVTTGTLGAGATTLGGNLTLGDNNIVAGTTTGVKIGTADTQKLGFYNATPVVQPAGADQAAVATTGATDVTPFGYTEAQANAIVTLVNEMRSVLVNLGLMKGAA